jgi:multidrug efflux pump subunit AcrA (membrane-fusion protein)
VKLFIPSNSNSAILPLSFLVVILALSGCNKQQPVEAKREPTGPVAVQTVPVVARNVQRTVEGVGTLFPYDETIISAEIEGRVDELNVDLGDQVSAGQVLLHINDEEQRYLLAQNEALLRQALERLGLKDENDRIADVRNAPEPRRVQAELYEAEQRYNRTKQLKDQGIAADADLDAAQARYRAAQAAYDSSLNQARNMIQMVEQYKAQLQLQRKKMRDTSVRAPFAGAVKERTVSLGQYVRPNSPLITLVKVDPLRLRLEVPERMAPWIRSGQTAEVYVEAFEDRRFEGKIWRISPTVDQSKRTFVVEALVSNPGAQLKPGSYARARVPTQKTERIKLLPTRAVNYVFGSMKAYVVKDGVVEARDVKTGDRFDDQIEIIEGVSEGEQVATTQISRLDTGARVRVEAGQ